MARATPTVEELLTPPSYTRPTRVDELVKQVAAAAAGPVRPAPADRRRCADASRRQRSRHVPDNDQPPAIRLQETDMPTRVRKAVFPRRRPRHPPAPRHQEHPQGDDHGRRPAADPICGRRGARGGDRAADLRHRPRQVGAGRLFRPGASSSRRRSTARARASTCSNRRTPASARSSPSASSSRSASVMRCGARGTSSATSRSRCCFPTS